VAGCAAAPAEPGADVFVKQHSREASRAAAAMTSVDEAVSQLSAQPTQSQLQALSQVAIRSRRGIAAATEWGVSENGEEEDLGQAQVEVSEGANAVFRAIFSLRAYARVPRPTLLASLKGQLARARVQWNSGISQLWYLARKSNPPRINLSAGSTPRQRTAESAV
jgi:hypothetical protein